MSDPIVGRFIGNVKRALAEHAEDSMKFPKADAFEHGRQIGVYAGLELALQHLNDIINDLNKEQAHDER